MKNYSSTLIAFLQANTNFYRPDLFTIAFPNGTTIHTTSHQTDLSYNSNTYFAAKFGQWTRGAITTAATYDATPEEMDLNVTCDSTVIFPGSNTPLLQTVASSIFDKARITVQTAYLPLSFNSSGSAAPVVDPNFVAVKFVGDIITAADPLTSTQATFKVSDLTYLLQEPWPRRVVQSGCPFSVYDKNCGLSPAGFTSAKTVASGSTALIINLSTALPNAAPYYDRGYVTFTSGQNTGLSMSIAKQLSTTQIQLAGPFLLPIFTGDTLNVVAGCDGLFTTCNTKFSNASKFGGEPYVPDPERALAQ